MADADGAGGRIAQALQAAGMRPVDLARRLKVSQPTVHGWVNQVHGITWANARRVAAVLKVAPGWIMFGADEEAERIAQTAQELAFLRLYRELDDSGQASVLRLLTAMQHPPSDPSASIPPKPKGPQSPRPFPAAPAAETAAKAGCATAKAAGGANVVPMPCSLPRPA
jgi:transcriptional regulator with XRE-family HTH domain